MHFVKTIIAASVFAIGIFSSSAHAKTVCTLVMDPDDERTISESGACETRATPASTFKIALALIGYDAGVLQSATAPKLPFKKGYVDWRGDVWRQDTTPVRWLKYSVVWYSQQIAIRMGAQAITTYLEKLGYGNADFSGDKGQDNALERAWIASSLEISPKEQVRFLSRMLTYQLPVKAEAVDLTKSIVETHQASGGWLVHGKTGMAYHRNPDMGFDRTRGWAWFVGWATKDRRQVVFARLIQVENGQPKKPAKLAMQSLLDELSVLVPN